MGPRKGRRQSQSPRNLGSSMVAACSLAAAMVFSAALAPPLIMEFSSSGTPRTHGLFVTRGEQAGARRVLSAFPVRTMRRHLLTRAPRMELHVHHIRRQK